MAGGKTNAGKKPNANKTKLSVSKNNAAKAKRRASKASSGGGGTGVEKKEKKKSPKRTSGKGRGHKGNKSRCVVDIFSEAAMDNAYSICHNVQDLLRFRGFAWPDAQKKKKKGKKK